MKSDSTFSNSTLPSHDMAQADEPASPCNLVCELDPASQFCKGCYRTMEEIAAWPKYSAAQKKWVLQVLPSRHRQHRSEQLPRSPARTG